MRKVKRVEGRVEIELSWEVPEEVCRYAKKAWHSQETITLQ